jgi:hypothetical protein
MTFDGINYAAVLAAAIAAWILAIVWYQILIKQWLARQGKTETELGPRRYPKAYVLWVFVVELIMARILADVVGHNGDVTLSNGIIWGVLCFTGFVGPVMVTSSYLLGRRGMLGVIELGYWLVALVLMGAIIGAFGTN